MAEQNCGESNNKTNRRQQNTTSTIELIDGKNNQRQRRDERRQQKQRPQIDNSKKNSNDSKSKSTIVIVIVIWVMRTGFAGSQKRASNHRSSLLRTCRKSDEGQRRSGEGRRSCVEIWRELKWLGQRQTTSKQYGSTSERAGMASKMENDQVLADQLNQLHCVP
ncbi:hypothetical protein RHGRI_014707 [Rhododendron griersonianum]|uniref:Uncharacterized protein n=1 Tax=Rhododendron griersonianum TaxID=479676 RepID=A0AAV6KAW8_9ERIC|nr:hypothetical protein RHGRI_014707 [Rhododendron griersonianum]